MTDRRSTCYGSQRPLPSRSLPRVLTNVKSSSSRHRWASWVDLLHRAYGRVFFAMLAVLAINLPGIIAALVKNGPGSPFYPIGYIQYATPVIKPAWLVFAQTAILQFLVAAFISLVVHLAVKIANNPTLGIVFVCALMGVTMVPGYYGRSIALREFALLNPLTYANTELTVGAYSPYPTTQIVNLPGLCFERGAIALVCAIGIEVLAISLLCVAGKSGCACPISPICLERGSFTASRTATRSSACASAVAYVRTMGKLLLRSPTLAVCAIAMSTTMLAPALVEMFPDADNVSAVRYRDGGLRSIDRYLEQNAANMDVEGKAALEDMRDALSGFVYAPMPAEGFRSLATYERARGELGAADATLLQSIGIEPETPSRAEARALLLESIASLPDPKVYELSTKMPPINPPFVSPGSASLLIFAVARGCHIARVHPPAVSFPSGSPDPRNSACAFSDGCCAGSPAWLGAAFGVDGSRCRCVRD